MIGKYGMRRSPSVNGDAGFGRRTISRRADRPSSSTPRMPIETSAPIAFVGQNDRRYRAAVRTDFLTNGPAVRANPAGTPIEWLQFRTRRSRSRSHSAVVHFVRAVSRPRPEQPLEHFLLPLSTLLR